MKVWLWLILVLNKNRVQFCVFFIKKFILSILYHRFIETSRFFLETCFFTFCDAGNPKMQKIPRSSQLANSIFMYKTKFCSGTVFDRIYWHLNFETLGMPLRIPKDWVNCVKIRSLSFLKFNLRYCHRKWLIWRFPIRDIFS